MKTFDPNNKISIEEYNTDLDISIEQIANGDVFTEEEMEEIIKTWGRVSRET
jgi:hypothetical protein